jgi:hypothetical protein
MLPMGFEHTISAAERSETYTLDGVDTGTGSVYTLLTRISNISYDLICIERAF